MVEKLNQIAQVKSSEVAKTQRKESETNISFAEILSQQVKFSAHAIQRLNSRNIELTVNQLEQLRNAVEKAEKKGARESLIIMDNLALVVSIKNKTVITAMDRTTAKENVFTNIDSAVII
jgi:flagellar operon protein